MGFDILAVNFLVATYRWDVCFERLNRGRGIVMIEVFW